MEDHYIADLTARYIYDVVRRLPSSQRDDVAKEIRGLVEDMLSSRTETPDKEDIQAVLLSLGSPADLADQYRDAGRYLIGPAYYDLYFLILRIVLAAVAFGITIALLISNLLEPGHNVAGVFSEIISGVISACFQAFAYVTIIFALMEKYQKGKSVGNKLPWHPDRLPRIPSRNARIPRAGCIVGIIFSVLFILIFNTSPHLLGIMISDNLTLIPLFDDAVLHDHLIFINIILFLGLTAEFLKLIWGSYTWKLAVILGCVNLASLVLLVFVFSGPAIWNAELPAQFNRVIGNGNIEASDIENYFQMFRTGVVILAALGYVIDTSRGFLRALSPATQSL
jgi:hypothetical protein